MLLRIPKILFRLILNNNQIQELFFFPLGTLHFLHLEAVYNPKKRLITSDIN